MKLIFHSQNHVVVEYYSTVLSLKETRVSSAKDSLSAIYGLIMS